MPQATGRQARQPGWRVIAADARGAHHVTNDMPYEDAWAVAPPSGTRRAEGGLVVAVADGHGHARHFRSSRGAKLAVEVATQLGTALGGELARATDKARVDDALRNRLGPTIVSVWRDKVREDIDADPITDDERAKAGLGIDPTFDELLYGYGATLLVTVAAGPWLGCLQLGDGDLFVVQTDGSVFRPLPIDPRLDGLRTTSLCQPDAIHSIRYEVLRIADHTIGAVMLATDGYGNAQIRDDWDVVFGADLAALRANHDTAWFADQLPAWVAQCASAEGSGDDVTVALIFAADVKWKPARPVAAVGEKTSGDGMTTVRDSAAGAVAAEETARLASAVPGGATATVSPDRTVPLTPAPRSSRGAAVPSQPRHAAAAAPAGAVTATRPAPRPAGPTPPTSHRQAPPPSPEKRSGWRMIYVIGALVVVAAVAVVLVIMLTGGKKAPANPTPTSTVAPITTPPTTPTSTGPEAPGQAATGTATTGKGGGVTGPTGKGSTQLPTAKATK